MSTIHFEYNETILNERKKKTAYAKFSNYLFICLDDGRCMRFFRNDNNDVHFALTLIYHVMEGASGWIMDSINLSKVVRALVYIF